MSDLEKRIEEELNRRSNLSFTEAFSIFSALAKKHNIRLSITSDSRGQTYSFEPVERVCPYAKMSCGEGDDGK